jgi:hypothetical protein
VAEPPWGIEPQTYALREVWHTVLGTLPALIAALAPRDALSAQSSTDCRSTIRSTARRQSGNRGLLRGSSVAETNDVDGAIASDAEVVQPSHGIT